MTETKLLSPKEKVIKLIADYGLDQACMLIRLKPTLEDLKAAGYKSLEICWDDPEVRQFYPDICTYFLSNTEKSLLNKFIDLVENHYEWEFDDDFGHGSTYFNLEDLTFTHNITIYNPETTSYDGNL